MTSSSADLTTKSFNGVLLLESPLSFEKASSLVQGLEMAAGNQCETAVGWSSGKFIDGGAQGDLSANLPGQAEARQVQRQVDLSLL